MFWSTQPTFHLPGSIDVLIGAALYPLLFTQESLSLGHNMPHLVGTHLGYVVMDTTPCALNSALASYSVTLHIDFLHDCESSGYMTKVKDSEPLRSSHCFLPHHGVFKQHGDSEKLCVVYDAICKTSSSISLNDSLDGAQVTNQYV